MLGLALRYIDPHDGSCIAVLARNLAESGRYGYARYGTFELWPVEATTGPTLIVPIALAFRLAGDGPFVANVACTLVVLVLLGFIWSQMVPRLRSVPAIASALLAIATIVGITIKPGVAFVVPRGEISAGLLLLLATLVALGRDEAPGYARAGTSGLLFGLGVASKVLLLLPGAPLFVAIVLRGWRAQGMRRAIAIGAVWVVGLVGVQALVEVWKLVSFGAWQPYAERWAEFFAFFRMAGSGFRVDDSPLAERRTLTYRLDVLYDNLGTVPLAFALALAVVPLVAWRARRHGGLGVDARLALVFGAQSAVVAAWWLFRADIPWLRYLFLACIAAPFCVHYAVLAAGRGNLRNTSVALIAWSVALTSALMTSPHGTVAWPAPPERHAERARDVLDAARVTREIAAADPQARFWSAGWWQHWDLQLAARLELSDLLDAASVSGMRDGHDYLLTSDYFNWEQNPGLIALLEAHERRVAYRNAFFVIYRIHPVLTRKALRAAAASRVAPWRAAAEH